MRNKLKACWLNVDKALLLALAIGSLAAWPFFLYPGLPRDTDAELHIFRIAELGHSLRAGNPYPRWAPNFYHGYGYPIFNYYAPLSYHIGNWLTLFTPEAAALGAKRLFILAHIVGALGAYLLGRTFGGQGGGLLGAAAFAFSPYIFLINPHVRGDLAEVVALAVLPWALWSWESLWRYGGRRNLLLAVTSAMAVLLSHNLTGLTMMALLMLLSAWHWLVLGQKQVFKWGLLAGVLVTGLTAYFWMPFLLEQSLVQLQNVAGDGHYDFRNHFVLLKDLLALLPAIDWRSTSLQIPFTVHPFLVGLATLGLGVAFQRDKFRSVLFYALATALCFWLITTQSEVAWTHIPGLSFYQFPWRFLGPLAALWVPLIASIAHIQLPKRSQSWLVAILVCLIMGFMLPGLYIPPWKSGFEETDKLAFLTFENQGRWRGTTSTNDFVPQTVDMIPPPQSSVLASYTNPPVDRVNRHTLPEGTQVTVLPDVPWHNRFHIKTPTSFILRLYLFYFPGWTAYIDGEQVPIEIAYPEGFVTLKIPPGGHDVVVQFQDTLPRKIGWGIALIASMVFIVALYYMPSYGGNFSNGHTYTRVPAVVMYSLSSLMVLICLKVTLFDATEWFRYTSPKNEALAASYTQKANLGGEILLLGFDVSHHTVKPGKRLDVTLYWNAQHPLTQTYQSFVHLVYPEGTIWAQSDHLNPAGFPTNLWPTDRYICDTHTLILPQDIPSGNYLLSVGIYTLRDARRLPARWAETGKRIDHIILSESITVRK